MDLHYSVDQELCVGCAECVNDCPYAVLEMQGDFPVVNKDREDMCIGCQHCLAVCSTGALSILGKNPADSLSLEGALPSAEQLATLMKGRRSVRRYQKSPVSPETIASLLETIAYAPTGINNQQVLFTVVDNPEIMDNLRHTTYSTLDAIINNGGLPAGMDFFEAMVKDAIKTGKDSIFRGAPHLLIVSAPRESPSPEADCYIALSYFELLAASMGLGTLWSGLAKWALAMIAPEILAKLGVPTSHQVGYMMVFGRPAVQYQRTVQRQNNHINQVAHFA